MDIHNLSFSYGTKDALKDLTFSVPQGTFAALLGPNGAGKSTLFALLTHLFVTTKGSIFVAGHSLADTPRDALGEIGVVFQNLTLDLDLTVKQNLRYFAALQGISGKAADARIATVLEQVNMAERAGETVRKLNGGHRRRAEIARSLIHNPSVLLLDEPTVGLDPHTRASITDHVHDLTTTHGITVLWATHLADEVRDTDQLIILNHGEILDCGICGNIRKDRDLATYFISRTRGAA